jgi:hypothetical protein
MKAVAQLDCQGSVTSQAERPTTGRLLRSARPSRGGCAVRAVRPARTADARAEPSHRRRAREAARGSAPPRTERIVPPRWDMRAHRRESASRGRESDRRKGGIRGEEAPRDFVPDGFRRQARRAGGSAP